MNAYKCLRVTMKIFICFVGFVAVSKFVQVPLTGFCALNNYCVYVVCKLRAATFHFDKMYLKKWQTLIHSLLNIWNQYFDYRLHGLDFSLVRGVKTFLFNITVVKMCVCEVNTSLLANSRQSSWNVIKLFISVLMCSECFWISLMIYEAAETEA